ncbi:uncharacterized protein K460DRAFT_192713 [Cucurbitaria berberidis CBS 394.84]|uniref:Secreted protein n=1 Tax=Cucurbitaria berberidis CBS 394.84 TaxID=1168544 RepID=A0A9P4G868_9PLEO|nr:uncharacterized protein K460DRAFT_192713 [Cucurbitaria berberidis CBS 394.84]KAF1840810.1 hypothetical protein K460DRAFT_192713 [Cucurbitaria berberidis CBS 394.84]
MSCRLSRSLFGSCCCLPLLSSSALLFQGTLYRRQKIHYGCIPLPRPQSDSTGTIDNRAKTRFCMDTISQLAATTARNSKFAP